MTGWGMRLNCTRCGSFTGYEDESDTVVACAECGKRHSRESVHMVDTDRRYKRDEAGNLIDGGIA